MNLVSRSAPLGLSALPAVLIYPDAPAKDRMKGHYRSYATLMPHVDLGFRLLIVVIVGLADLSL